MHTSRQYASKVNPYPPAVAQTTYPMRNGVLGKRTADDIVQMKIEDIIGKKLGDYEHPNKKQKTFNGGVPSSKNVPQTHPTPQATGSKILYMGNLRYTIKESDIINFFKDAGEVIKIRLGTKNGQFAGYAHVDFATSDAAQKAIKLNGELLLNRPVKLDFAPERGSNTPSDMALAIEKKQEQNKTAAVTANGDVEAKHNEPKSNDNGILDKLQPPETPQAIANTLFVANLSFSVTKIDIVNFFKDAGEIVDIRLAMKNDWFIGFGLVEFATRDAALKAFKLNGELLLNRPVKLEFARNRGADPPSNSNWRFSQNSLQSQGLTVLVEGFGTFSGVDDPYDSIRCVLEEHFGQCGEITRMYIPKDYENDCPQGVAYIDFINHEAFSKALELSGSEVSGGTITVKDANQSGGEFVKGKTDAEDTIEKNIVDSKKQNLVKDDVAPAAEKKKEEQNKTAAVTENGDVEAKNNEPESNDSGILLDEPKKLSTSETTESKILFVGNLGVSVEKTDMLNFFKVAGEVVEVRFTLKNNQFAGCGHVEFATHDAAQKALKLDGLLLLDQAVTVEVAKEKGANTGNERFSQKSGESQPLTAYVRGFSTHDGFDSVRSSLEEHFGKCGEISRMSIPKDYESDGPKGVAFIDFTDREAFNKALELSGSEVCGGTLIVEEAKQKGGERFGGGRGGWSGGRGRFGGRGGGRFGGRGF